MRRALVVYGSKRGGTAGLAEMIGAELGRHGWQVKVQDATIAADLRDLDLVIIGGALYTNRWHKAARRFARRHRAALRTLPVWLFSSGPLDDSANAGDLAPVVQVQGIARALDARGHMTFGGRLEAHPGGFFARTMAKQYAGDYRDPTQVADWVHHIEHELTPVELTLPRQRIAAHDVTQRQSAGTRSQP